MRLGLQFPGWIWASPYTLVGVLIGLISLLAGGSVRRRGRVLEFVSPAERWILAWLPGVSSAAAITLGHTIVGRSTDCLDDARIHEMVHVRQYEIWGPMMGPAYLLCSLVLWVAGRDPYRDNPFERQAFRVAGG